MTAKDYFEDILSEPERRARQGAAARDNNIAHVGGERTIRNISVSPRRPVRMHGGDMRNAHLGPPRARISGENTGDPRRKWIWIAAAVSFVVLVLLGLFAFRATKIT